MLGLFKADGRSFYNAFRTKHEDRMTDSFVTSTVKKTIPIELLEQVDIRVGTIEMVGEVKGSEKLVRLTVDFGDFKRNILAGLKTERADPTMIEGKQALFVVNIEPRRMLGEVSEGMLFDIGYSDGLTPVLAVPESFVPNGARAG